MQKKRWHKNAHRRSGPVKISYLPGFGPPSTGPVTKYPFRATINGRPCTVTETEVTYEEDR